MSIPNGYEPPPAVCDISAWQCIGQNWSTGILGSGGNES